LLDRWSFYTRRKRYYFTNERQSKSKNYIFDSRINFWYNKNKKENIMITVKNFDTLLKLPSTPKEGDLAYIEEPKGNKEKVFCYIEGKWTPVNPDGEVKANLYDINATAIA
jgi:hypothetical protein